MEITINIYLKRVCKNRHVNINGKDVTLYDYLTQASKIKYNYTNVIDTLKNSYTHMLDKYYNDLNTLIEGKKSRKYNTELKMFGLPSIYDIGITGNETKVNLNNLIIYNLTDKTFKRELDKIQTIIDKIPTNYKSHFQVFFDGIKKQIERLTPVIKVMNYLSTNNMLRNRNSWEIHENSMKMFLGDAYEKTSDKIISEVEEITYDNVDREDNVFNKDDIYETVIINDKTSVLVKNLDLMNKKIMTYLINGFGYQNIHISNKKGITMPLYCMHNEYPDEMKKYELF